jgi:hypothetical protein
MRVKRRGIGLMSRWHIVMVLAVCAQLSACSRIQEAAMPVADKINAAYPVQPEAKLARDRLIALIANDPKAQKELGTVVDAQMTLRALTCAKGLSIGRLDAVAAVRQRKLDPLCFQRQDQELMTLFGIRTLGALLAQPALRPLQALGPEKL